MGSISSTKLAAVVAAVLRHASEAAGAEAPERPAAAVAPCAPPPVPSNWASAGRQSSMLDRVVWQRRLGKTW